MLLFLCHLLSGRGETGIVAIVRDACLVLENLRSDCLPAGARFRHGCPDAQKKQVVLYFGSELADPKIQSSKIQSLTRPARSRRSGPEVPPV